MDTKGEPDPDISESLREQLQPDIQVWNSQFMKHAQFKWSTVVVIGCWIWRSHWIAWVQEGKKPEQDQAWEENIPSFL